MPQIDLNLIAVFGFIFTLVVLIARLILRQKAASNEPRKLELVPPAFGSLTEPLSYVVPHADSKRKKIAQELVDAGFYHKTALINFLSLRNVAMMGVTLVFAMLLTFGNFSSTLSQLKVLSLGFAALILTYGIPRIILSGKATKRTRQIEHALPDALDMIAMSVEGGLPMSQSLHRVSGKLTQTHPHLAQELRIIGRQSETGTFDQAMASFGKRITLPDVAAWSAMMQQSHRLGGNVVDRLRSYADRIRHKRKQRAERSGNLASVKLLLPIVFCLTPPVFIVLIGPGILEFRSFILQEAQVENRIDIPDVASPQAERISEALDLFGQNSTHASDVLEVPRATDGGVDVGPRSANVVSPTTVVR